MKGRVLREAGFGLAFTRYCHHQDCMGYGMQKADRWKGVYCAMVVQWYRNRVGFVSGGGRGVIKG